jgi:ABC-type uncharacterized transport system ATPase subunit
MRTEIPIRVDRVSKRFEKTVALDEVSLEIHQGEIFGMLGPNGAGKTTLIRTVLDIIKPDSGRIEIFGRPFRAEDRDRLGYLPEERGLYPREEVGAVLEYLGCPSARTVNAVIRDYAAAGHTVVLSTHQMGLVEALCTRVLMIVHGRAVLYGNLRDIKTGTFQSRGPRTVVGAVRHLSLVARVERPASDGQPATVYLRETATSDAFLAWLVAHQASVESFERLSFVPLTTPVMMMLRIASADVPAADIVVSMVIGGAAIYLALRGAARIFRAAALMYGKRPTLPEVVRWLRAA